MVSSAANCALFENAVLLHGPTATLVCALAPQARTNAGRLSLAAVNGTCPSGSTRWTIPAGNPLAADDSYQTGVDTLLTVPAPGVLANDALAGGAITAYDAVSLGGGSVSLATDGSFTYTPPVGFTGSDSFSYTLTGPGGFDSATVTIAVSSFPIAVDDEFTLSGNFRGVIPAPGVLANDTLFGATITDFDTTSTLGGTVHVFADGSVRYVAPTGVGGVDSFTYTISNGAGSSTATVTLILNSPPNAVDDEVATDEDTPVSGNVLANDSDPDNDPLVITHVNGVAVVFGTPLTLPSGALLTINADGSFTWDPNGAFNFLAVGETDTDSFTYTLTDPFGAADTATVTITITGLNDTPDAVDDTAATDEDTPIAIDALANDTDPDASDVLTIQSFTAGNGSVIQNPDGTLQYDPSTFYNDLADGETATDTIAYSVSDSIGGTDSATITVTISGLNDAPTADDQSLTTLEEQPLAITLTGSDPDAADVLTFSVVSGPSNGVLSGTEPNLTYTPNTDFAGSDSFTFQVDDGNGGTDTGTISITVTGVNDPPSFTPGGDETALEDAGPVTVTAWATDISAGPADESGQLLTFTVTVTGTTGTLAFTTAPAIDATTGDLTFETSPDTNGTATVDVTLSDDGGTANGGDDTSATETFTLTVTAVNDAPSFTPGGDVTVAEDSGAYSQAWATAISAGPSDESGQVLTFTATVTSGAGQFSVAPAIAADGTLSFTLADNASGTATLDVVLSDDGGTANGGDDTSETHVLTITATAVNDAPVLDLDGATVPVETADTVQYPGAPVALAPDALVTDVDSPDFDSGSLTASLGLTATAEDQFAIGGGAFSVSGGAVTYVAGGVVIGQIDATDDGVNGADLLIVLNANATPAIVSELVQALTYATSVNPASDLSDRDVTLTVVDGDGGSDSASATVSVVHNQPPVADDTSATTDEDTAVTVNLSASDADGDGLTFAIASGPSNGSLGAITGTSCSGATPNVCTAQVLYTPDADYNGGDSFTYTANDGSNDSDPATATLTIDPVNDAPSFTKDADQTVFEDAGAQTVNPWATAISPGPADESGQMLTFVVTDNTNPGLFSAAPAVSATGVLTYTPAANAFGSATISIRLDDNGPQGAPHVHQSAVQTFNITVTGVNDAPSFTPGANVTVTEDAAPYSAAWATAISAGPNETGQTLTFVIDSNSNPGLFTAGPAIASDGTLTFTLAADAFGAATLSVRLTDDGGTANGGIDTTTAVSLTITVTPVNDPPTLAGGTTKTTNATAHLELTVTQNLLYDAVDKANEVATGSVLSARIANDPASALLAAGTELTTTRGGKVIITATGFRYQPPAGVTGGAADTAAYFICDTGFPAPGLCTQLTLSFAIGGELVWFINGAASNNGDGTMFDPFNTIANFNTYNIPNAALTAGDVVFLYSGTYTNGIALVSGQRLFGLGAPAGTVFHTATGLAAPVTGSAYPSIVGTAPNIDSGAGVFAVTLNNTTGNNTLRYLTLGTAGARAGAGITGTSFGTLTVGDVSIDTDGQALLLTNGTLTPVSGSNGFGTVNSAGGTNNVALTSIATSASISFGTGTLIGATSSGVVISQQNGTFTFGQTIQNTASGAQAVSILNRTGGTVTFSGSINPTAGVGDAPAANSRGISISGSAGTYTFSGAQVKIASATLAGVNVTGGTATVEFTGGRLVIVTTTGNGLSATAGTLRVTGANNTITSVGGIALNVSGATIGSGGLTFLSISANGGPNGIVLNNTGSSAGLTVTGNSNGNCGGVANPASGPVIADCTGGAITGARGAGIVLTSTASVSLTRMNITGSADDGIRGTSVNGFTLISSVVQNNGAAGGDVATQDRGADFVNLTGVVTITNTTFTGSTETNLRVPNTSGTLSSMTVTGSTFSNTAAATGDDGVLLLIDEAANITASITGSRFVDNKGDHFQAATDATVTGMLKVTFSNNTLTSSNTNVIVGGGITISPSGGAQTTALISNNNIQGAVDDGININNGTASTVSSVLNVTISGNTVGNPGVANSGSFTSNTITVRAVGAGTVNALIDANSVYQWGNEYGISATTTEGSAPLNVTITDNTVSNPGTSGFGINGIHLSAGATAGPPADNATMCADVQDNSAAGSGLGASTDIRLRQRFNTTIRLPGYGGSASDTAAVNAFVAGNNTGTDVSSVHNVGGGGNGFVGGASCTQPAQP